MISDRHVHLSLTQVLAWVAWVATSICIVLAIVVHESDITGDRDDGFLIAAVGLALSAAAATLHIRSVLVTFSRHLREAFELGREVEREHQRDLRSIR